MGCKNYNEFRQVRQQVLSFAGQLSEPLEILGLTKRAEASRQVCEKLTKDTFKVMVVGEFKRGKSTFINALLGKNLLPVKVPPCTAVITEVKYGETSKALLHYRDETKLPVEIPLEEIKDYITIQEAIDKDELEWESPYKKLELFYPLELCKNNLEIIDSPGLNESDFHQYVSEDYLTQMDASVFMLSCGQFFSESEQCFLKNYSQYDNPVLSSDNLLIAANHFDKIADDQEEIDALEKRRNECLRRIFSGKLLMNQFFFVSSKQALQAKIASDAASLEKSRFPAIETGLEEFLAKARGKIKIARALRETRCIIREALAHYPNYLAMLNQDVKELEAKLNEIGPRLKKLELDKERILGRMQRGSSTLLHKLTMEYKNLEKMLEGELGTWFEQYESQTSCLKMKEYIEEIQKGAKEKSDEIVHQWKNDNLASLLQENMKIMVEEADQEAGEFLIQVEALHKYISGITPKEGAEVDVPQYSGLNRVLSSVGGFILFGSGGAVMGSVVGLKDLVKFSWVNLLDVAVAVVLTWTNPVILIPIMLYRTVMLSLNHKSITGGVEGHIKYKIKKTFDANLDKALQNSFVQIDKIIEHKLDEFRHKVEDGFDMFIEEVRDQLHKAISDKKNKGKKLDGLQNTVQQAKKCIVEIDEKLEEVYDKINQ